MVDKEEWGQAGRVVISRAWHKLHRIRPPSSGTGKTDPSKFVNGTGSTVLLWPQRLHQQKINSPS